MFSGPEYPNTFRAGLPGYFVTTGTSGQLGPRPKGGIFIESNQGYEILQSVVFTNSRGYALGHNPGAVSPYVTWAFYENTDGSRDYNWGHYFSEKENAVKDFAHRAAEHRYQFGVEEREPGSQRQGPEHYRYYSTQRPVDINTYPNQPGNRPVEIFNYDERIPVEGGKMLAWGELIYEKPLTEKQMCDCELKPSSHNPDRRPSITARLKKDARRTGPKEPGRQKNHKPHEDR